MQIQVIIYVRKKKLISQRWPFLCRIFFILLGIDLMIFSTSLMLTSSILSKVIMFSNASSFSFFKVKLKNYPIGLKLGLRSGIENTSALTFFMAFKPAAEFSTRHPSCKSKRPSQCSVFLYISGKILCTIDANRLPSKQPWYWWHRTTPRPDRATLKCAIRPPVTASLPLVIHKGFSPSDFFLQAIVLKERDSSCGLRLCVNPVPSR